MPQSIRKRLPDERASITHRFEIGGNKGFITVGMYPDKTLGEVFIVMSKEGSTLSGLLDTVAVMISMALQHGTPIEAVVGKLANVKYEPAGMTNNPCIKTADSITDYIGRYLGMKFVDLATLERVGVKTQCHDCDKTVERDGKKYSCIAALLTP
jgi:ribonucleoside-diphosphate reductase alpha chain